MKVLMLNGSPRPEGNTTIALREMEQIFQAEGVEIELVQVGNRDIRVNGPRFSNIFIEKRDSSSLQTVAISWFLFFMDSNQITLFFQNSITIILLGAAI